MSRSTAARDGAPVADQVFVDASGRRGRVVRWIGALLGLGCLIYVGVVLLVANSSRVTGPLPAIPVEGNGLVPGFPAATAPPGVLSALPMTQATARPTARAPVRPVVPKTAAPSATPRPLPTTPRITPSARPRTTASRTATAPLRTPAPAATASRSASSG